MLLQKLKTKKPSVSSFTSIPREVLLKSTRNIVGDIMESSVPVVVYISPAGADAGSAGVFITLSANIAAMAPGTNIGAAHPVTGGEVDSVMYGKITNDAAAFIRTIAKSETGIFSGPIMQCEEVILILKQKHCRTQSLTLLQKMMPNY